MDFGSPPCFFCWRLAIGAFATLTFGNWRLVVGICFLSESGFSGFWDFQDCVVAVGGTSDNNCKCPEMCAKLNVFWAGMFWFVGFRWLCLKRCVFNVEKYTFSDNVIFLFRSTQPTRPVCWQLAISSWRSERIVTSFDRQKIPSFRNQHTHLNVLKAKLGK